MRYTIAHMKYVSIVIVIVFIGVIVFSWLKKTPQIEQVQNPTTNPPVVETTPEQKEDDIDDKVIADSRRCRRDDTGRMYKVKFINEGKILP